MFSDPCRVGSVGVWNSEFSHGAGVLAEGSAPCGGDELAAYPAAGTSGAEGDSRRTAPRSSVGVCPKSSPAPGWGGGEPAGGSDRTLILS
jgi:hypothetical protein